MVSCILLAAGSGKRMKRKQNKVYLRIANKSLMQWCLLHMQEVKSVAEIIVVVAKGEEEKARREIDALDLTVPVTIVLGGATRQESVSNGLDAVTVKDIVLVHDSARPMAEADVFERVIEATRENEAVVPAIPVVDTIKVAQEGVVEQTLPRSVLWRVQTPQGFNYDLLVKAHEKAVKNIFVGTDDASLVEYMGKPVHLVEGDTKNVKITTPEDLVLARHYLGAEPMRIGFGYDIHRLVTDRPCILGGVSFEYELGLDGHSDADVVAHALMDALLGAAGLRDIGYYFPPTDPAYEGADSMALLASVKNLLREQGYEPYNVDITVIAEMPKVNPRIDEMKEKLVSVLGIDSRNISIKATTNEGLGAVGRREGIAAHAVVTIQEREEI